MINWEDCELFRNVSNKKLYYLLIIVIHAHKLEGVANNSADLAQSIMASSSPDEDTDEEEEEVEVKRKPTNNEW